MYNVSYFCAGGNSLKENQDRVLVNKDLLRDGIRHQRSLPSVEGFVADGIGSLINSGNAAQFVLAELSQYDLDLRNEPKKTLTSILTKINNDLVKLNRIPGLYQDSGTTLCGIIIQDQDLLPINVGDSEILVVHHDELYRITIHQVVDSEQPNSPIISYMGGTNAQMEIDFTSGNYMPEGDDIIIVTTDGLLKAISRRELVIYLRRDATLEERIDSLYQELISKEVPDNLGAIFIERTSG